MLSEKLVYLKREIVTYAGFIESMFIKTMEAFIKSDLNELQEIIKKDEEKANHFEVEIDELCTNIIALYEPKAKDLRIILMILKMNNDLERMGDHCVNIAQSARDLVNAGYNKYDLTDIYQNTLQMYRNALEAFINEDHLLAKKVCETDNIIDECKNSIYKTMVKMMTQDTKIIESALQIMRIAGNLERIADLSTNISEDVIFIVKGKVIKHNL
ncbi:MAG: phosphate signaling complex protein PhoU [bacterium]|nr:phosphate signaling complex protein PhoU [bacterium]